MVVARGWEGREMGCYLIDIEFCFQVERVLEIDCTIM